MTDPTTLEECDQILDNLEQEFDHMMANKKDDDTGWGSTADIRAEYSRIGLIRVNLFMAQQISKLDTV